MKTVQCSNVAIFWYLVFNLHLSLFTGTCPTGNWPDRGEAGLGLGQLVTRVNKNTELLDTLEMLETGGDKLWGAWDSSRDQAW